MRPLILPFALAVSLPFILAASSTPPSPTEARLERVAEGIYVILHDDATDEWPHGNTGVIVTDEGVLVVDAAYLPSRAAADIALIRSITDRPVRYLVYTHWHFDHNNGGIAYREAFPEVSIVSERNTARHIEINGIWWSRMTTAPESAKRRSLAALETQLNQGKDAAGAALTTEARRSLEAIIGRRKNELRELESLRVVTPDRVFDDRLTLTLGGRTIDLVDQGRANSPNDVTVWLPDARVLFTGDILVQAPLPYVGASWPLPWIQVLRRIEGIPAQTIVPGHGPVQRDHAYTVRVRSLLEAATSRVERLIREGKTLEQVQAGVDLEDARKGFAPWNELEDPADWKTTTDVLVERAWRGVRGQG